MWNRLIVWSLALALATFPALTAAQSPQVRATVLTKRNLGAVPAGPPVFTYLGDGTLSGTNGTTGPWTLTGAPLGNPAYILTRRIVVFVAGPMTDRTPVCPTSTVNGAASSNCTTSSGVNGNISSFSALVPSGTSGDIIITFSDTQFSTNEVVFYMVDNNTLVSPAPVATYHDVTSATSNTSTVATLTDGVLVALDLWANSTAKSPSFTASTEGIVADPNVLPSYVMTGFKNGISAQAASSVTAGWTGSFDGQQGLFAFR